MNPHFRKNEPTEAEIAFARAEVACCGVSQDVAFERCMEARRAWLDALRDLAVCGAELWVLEDMARGSLEATRQVYALAKNGLLKAEP